MAAGAFVKGERYPYTAEGWKTFFRRAVERAGIKDFRMHDNRHTAASRLHREIRPARGAGSAFGTSQIETTRKYTHVNNDEKLMTALQRAADKADAERQNGNSSRGGGRQGQAQKSGGQSGGQSVRGR